MPRYSEKRKAAVLKKMLPPHNQSVAEVAESEGISLGTLYNWRGRAKQRGAPVPGSGKISDHWSAEAKLAVVIETATMSESELSEYCRQKGLYPEQIKEWKAACIQGQLSEIERRKQERAQTKQDKKRIKELERKLTRKEKALAETAAFVGTAKKAQCPLGRKRGRLTVTPERQQMVEWINEAIDAGARKEKASKELGLSIRTIQRWVEGDKVKADQRPLIERPKPNNKLSEGERSEILAVCNQPAYASIPPSQIVPRLADEGRYLGSESSFYRILNEAAQLNHRGRSKEAKRSKVPTTHIATQANQVWSWDISYLPSNVRALYHYLYLIEDIYSRKIVGWEVHSSETGKSAADLVQRTVLAEQCFRKPLVLHSDNGSPMKSYTLQSKLVDLGITPSHSRPRVSNDNAYSESLFRTLKYCPQWPSQGFSSLEIARDWVSSFVSGYNNEHRHSRIKFVTPAQRHQGEDKAILQKRNNVYESAKARNPWRWSGKTRNWRPIGNVTLNPERIETKEAA